MHACHTFVYVGLKTVKENKKCGGRVLRDRFFVFNHGNSQMAFPDSRQLAMPLSILVFSLIFQFGYLLAGAAGFAIGITVANRTEDEPQRRLKFVAFETVGETPLPPSATPPAASQPVQNPPVTPSKSYNPRFFIADAAAQVVPSVVRFSRSVCFALAHSHMSAQISAGLSPTGKVRRTGSIFRASSVFFNRQALALQSSAMARKRFSPTRT